ncbi:MAG: hypothetical protein M1822_002436 [Bathelium mastoideum]|nr:MAG: hypothetical protein M1822_002436 [Bathelium mastoideum]
MTTSGSREAISSSSVLETARIVYAKHFWERQTFEPQIGEALYTLRSRIDAFTRCRQGDSPDENHDRLFILLTQGLHETLNGLDKSLADVALAQSSANVTRRNSDLRPDSSWSREQEIMLKAYSLAVDVTIEALERQALSQINTLAMIILENKALTHIQTDLKVRVTENPRQPYRIPLRLQSPLYDWQLYYGLFLKNFISMTNYSDMPLHSPLLSSIKSRWLSSSQIRWKRKCET